MDKMENLYVCVANVKDNQLNDKHSAMYDKIFDTVLKRERHLTYFSFCTPLLSLCYGSQL
jgi:hypothetical protein